MAIAVGEIVEGKVTGVANFGAFVELEAGAVGLVHISQINYSYVTDIAQHIKVGDRVKVKVVGLRNGKYDLSIKQAMDPPSMPIRRKPMRQQKDRPSPGSFEDKMLQFLKQSEETQLDLKKNLQSKQDGRKRKKI